MSIIMAASECAPDDYLLKPFTAAQFNARLEKLMENPRSLLSAILFLDNFRLSPGGPTVTVTFNFLGDLRPNAPVKYAGGIEVGEVRDIRIIDGKVACDLLITRKGFKLRKDSQVTVYTAGLLGSNY